MSCNCQKCLYEEPTTTDSTAHSADGDHATFDTRKLAAGTFVEIGARRFFKSAPPVAIHHRRGAFVCGVMRFRSRGVVVRLFRGRKGWCVYGWY